MPLAAMHAAARPVADAIWTSVTSTASTLGTLVSLGTRARQTRFVAGFHNLEVTVKACRSSLTACNIGGSDVVLDVPAYTVTISIWHRFLVIADNTTAATLRVRVIRL